MNEPIIVLEKLSKSYAKKKVVDNLSLQIHEGEIYGLLGPNGAGKTTSILMMMGLTEPTSGNAYIAGLQANKHPIEVKKMVGYLPDSVGFYDDMSALDNLKLIAKLNQLTEIEIEEKSTLLLEQVGLKNDQNKLVGTYSRGMKQRLGLAEVLIKNPKIIILDEPTLGLDPQGIQEFLELIKELSKSKKLTVLLSSHHLHHVQQVCDRVGIFVQGELIISGNIAELGNSLTKKEGYITTIEMENESLDISNLKAQLSNLPIIRIELMSTNIVEIKTSTECTAALVKTLALTGYAIVSVQRNNLTLEHIYQQYFLENSKFQTR